VIVLMEVAVSLSDDGARFSPVSQSLSSVKAMSFRSLRPVAPGSDRVSLCQPNEAHKSGLGFASPE
jgi:hypothetical protein